MESSVDLDVSIFVEPFIGELFWFGEWIFDVQQFPVDGPIHGVFHTATECDGDALLLPAHRDSVDEIGFVSLVVKLDKMTANRAQFGYSLVHGFDVERVGGEELFNLLCIAQQLCVVGFAQKVVDGIGRDVVFQVVVVACFQKLCTGLCQNEFWAGPLLLAIECCVRYVLAQKSVAINHAGSCVRMCVHWKKQKHE